MISQLLTTGQIIVRGYYGNDITKYREEVLDYGFTQKDTLTGAASWDQSTADIYGDLSGWADALRTAGYDPSTCILGKDAWENARTNAAFTAIFDPRRLDLGTIRPDVTRIQQGAGLKYIGFLPGIGIELWVYYGQYKAYTGTVTDFVPADHVLMMPSMPVGDIAYGAVTWLDPTTLQYITTEGTRIPRIKANTNGDVLENHLYSRPVPRPVDVDSWYAADVINA